MDAMTPDGRWPRTQARQPSRPRRARDVYRLRRPVTVRPPSCRFVGGRPATGLGSAAMGVEARLREVEQRLAAANGLEVQERWVDVVSPAVRVRVLESGSGYPVLFINGISVPGIGMAPLAGRLPGRRILLVDLPGHGLSPPYAWKCAPLQGAGRRHHRRCARRVAHERDLVDVKAEGLHQRRSARRASVRPGSGS